MPKHTVRLNERDTRRIDLSRDEAVTMVEKGFRFSIYSLASNEFQLSILLELLIDRDRGMLTIVQDDEL
jgi:hypothetical protein